MKKQLLSAVIATLVTCSAVASNKKQISDNFTVDPNSTVYIDVAVGEVELKTHDSDEIELRVLVKEMDHHWFSSVNVDDAILDKRITNSGIHLEIEEDDTEQEWQIVVPKSANIRLNVGVGGVDIESFSKNLDVEVGVGDIEIGLADNNYRRIELEAGVGSAELDGFSGARTERAIVSEDVSWRGEGEYEINAEVGVGDLDVRY